MKCDKCGSIINKDMSGYTHVFGIPTTDELKCRLLSDDLVVVPHDKGEPPSWVPTFLYRQVVWVDRELFTQLKHRKNEMPCDICPDEIKNRCALQ